ncbi:MAG: GNAT family N-acetyltransferase [Steroidobacteraceae bacterium]
MSVLIRRGGRQDARFLAWAMLTASRGHLEKGWFDIALNQPENRCLEFLHALTTAAIPSRWHYSRFLVAETEDGAAAALCAFRTADAYQHSLTALAQTADMLGLPSAEQALIWQRGAYLSSCTIRPDDDSLLIESIATLPKFRRRGYTAALLERATEEGRAAGRTQAEMAVFIGNDPAERGYLKAGFRCVGELRHPAFAAVCGAAGQRRLLKVL